MPLIFLHGFKVIDDSTTRKHIMTDNHDCSASNFRQMTAHRMVRLICCLEPTDAHGAEKL